MVAPKYKILIIVLFGLITACTPQATPDPAPTKLITIAGMNTPVPTKTVSPSPTYIPTESEATASFTPASSSPLQHQIESIAIPACLESETSDTQTFNELLESLTISLYELESYRYRTLYRYTMEDRYADEELSVEIVGAHSNLLDTPTQGFFYPLTSQTYERSQVVLTDLPSMSSSETIVREDGLWVRDANATAWAEFDSATSGDMINLADMFSPHLVLSFMIGGGGLAPGVRADKPTMAQVETIDGLEVMHRCWILPELSDEISAYLIHYESLYTFFNDAEIHLWTTDDDSQLVRLVLTGMHIGERLGEYEGNMHDTPSEFLLWMDLFDLDRSIDITFPNSDEIGLFVSSDLESLATVASPYNEFPHPEDAEATGTFGRSEWLSDHPREYWYPVSSVRDNVLSYYAGSGWYQTPEDRLPSYVTKLNLTEATAFYLEEMDHRGWHLKEKFLQTGWPELYLIFERDGAILLVFLEPEGSEDTKISAILPPPDDVLDAILSGWVSLTAQNKNQYTESINAIAFDKQGRTWIGTDKGLKIFDGMEWTTLTAHDLDLAVEEPDFEVMALAVDQQGQVWVGTQERLSVFDGQAWKTYTTENSELESTPWTITVDGTGKVWLGHGYSSSVSVFDGTTFTNYSEDDIGMPGGHNIDVIDTDQQDRIWIATSGGGIYMFDGTSWIMVVDAKSPANTTNVMTSIEDLVIDYQGRVWVGSGVGLSVFDGKTWTNYTTENSGLADDWVKSLGIDQDNKVWTVTTGGRLNVLDPNGEWRDYTPINPEISLYFPEVVAIDPQGRVWVGTDWDGVSVFTPPNTTPLTLAPPVPTPTPTPTPTPRAPYKIRGGECLGSADDALVDLDCREITIAVENANLPFNYVLNETNEPGGWDYDAWEEICTRLHCTPVYVEAPWDGMVEAIADGQYDTAADGITYWQYREELVDYSEGYISIDQRLLVRADETRITEIEDIINDSSLKLGALIGTTNYVIAYDNLSSHDRIEGFENTTSSIQALISGEIDALIVNDLADVGYVGEDENGLVHLGEDEDKVKLVGRSLYNDWLGFIYPKGSDLVEPVNLALQSMMADHFLDDLNKKYFGPEFTITYDDIGLGAYGE